MSALPEHPTERDRERFRDLTKAMQFGLEYDRRLASNGDYTDPQTVAMFRLWWSVERERQLLQNLNMSQGCKLSELGARAEKAESELEAERKRLDWALNHGCVFRPRSERLFWHFVEKLGHSIERTTDPRATIDELIAGEPK